MLTARPIIFSHPLWTTGSQNVIWRDLLWKSLIRSDDDIPPHYYPFFICPGRHDGSGLYDGAHCVLGDRYWIAYAVFPELGVLAYDVFTRGLRAPGQGTVHMVVTPHHDGYFGYFYRALSPFRSSGPFCSAWAVRRSFSGYFLMTKFFCKFVYCIKKPCFQWIAASEAKKA